MQISRHWRMNPQRYRLEGVRFSNGEVSLQPREVPTGNQNNIVLEFKPDLMNSLNPPISVGQERK